MSQPNNAGLLNRLKDLEREAEQIAGIVQRAGAVPDLLLARLLVFVDKATARLAKHRQALDSAIIKHPPC